MDDQVVAIILAGGQGTRIRGLYPQLPKLLVPAAGEPFVEWILRHLAAQGIRRFVVSLGYLAEVAESYFRNRSADGLEPVSKRSGTVPILRSQRSKMGLSPSPRTVLKPVLTIRTVREATPLGTAGGFCLAREIGAPDAELLVVVNGDSLVVTDFAAAWRLLDDPTIDGVVLGVEVLDASRYGRIDVDHRNRLLRFCEKQPGHGLINAGVYFFRRRLCEQFPKRRPLSMELDVFPELLAAGANIAVARCEASFIDIGTPESVAGADTFIEHHLKRAVPT
jgi:D-glycero-alpha-D-manno-heptose 1-phosphate guanylyltransferase